MTCIPSTLWEETLETLGAGTYTEYRIPGIIVTQRGTVLICYEGRMSTNDDWAKIDTVICRRASDADEWTKTPVRVPVSLGGTDNDCTNNPTLIADGAMVHLIFHQNYARVFHCVSIDDGQTWTEPAEITASYREFPMEWNVCATGPGHGIALRGGRLIAPVWLANGRILDDRRIAHQPSRAGVIYSDDHGATWHAGALTEGVVDANETCCAQLPDGRVLFNFRNLEEDFHRRIAISEDGGNTFGKIVRCDDLPCPRCFGGMATLPDGSIVYAGCRNNGDISPDAPRGRIHMSLCITEDAGATWQHAAYVNPIGGYADVAVHGSDMYLLYEMTENGVISRMMLRKYSLSLAKDPVPVKDVSAPEKGFVIKKGAVCHQPDQLFGYYGWPSVCRMEDGTLAVVTSGPRMGHLCFQGKTALFLSRDDGETWMGPTIITDSPLDDRDAGILPLGGKKLLVMWFTLPGARLPHYQQAIDNMTPQQSAAVKALTMHYTPEIDAQWAGSLTRLSADGGATWSEPRFCPLTSPHGPIFLRDGRIMIVGKEYPEKEGDGRICCAVSSDEGAAWDVIGVLPLPESATYANLHEPDVVELPDGRLLAQIRYQHCPKNHSQEGFTIFQSVSDDGGKTWSTMQPLHVCGSPPHLLLHSSGVLVSTYGRREKPFGLMAMFSRDMGKTWETEYQLDVNPHSGDLGYPASVELPDGSILTVWYEQSQAGKPCGLSWLKWKINV